MAFEIRDVLRTFALISKKNKFRLGALGLCGRNEICLALTTAGLRRKYNWSQ